MNLPSPSKYVLEDRIAAFTLDLCKISSVTGDEGEISTWLEAWFKTLPQYEVSRVGHSFALRNAWRGRPIIALVGHTDTVPAHPGDPVACREGNRLTGLGASDMKGGLAVMMALMEDIDVDACDYDLAFVFYDAEEGPFVNSGLGPLLEIRTSCMWSEHAFPMK